MTTLREAFAGMGLQPDYGLIVEAIRSEYLGQTSAAPAASSAQVAVAQGRHAERRRRAAARLALYRDDVAKQIDELIAKVYTKSEVREDRKRLAEMIGFSNVPKRITDEIASLYAVPAKRRFEDQGRALAFRQVERDLDLHSVMKEAHRLCFLLNNVLLWSLRTGDTTSLRIVTPDRFDVVVNPRNSLDLVAVLIDCAPAWTPATVQNVALLPHYELWDSEVKITLDLHGRIIGAPEAHGQGRIPGVLMSSRLPVDRLLDDRPGEDIFHAARAVLFLNLLLLSLSHNSSERQPYIQGALAEMASEQPQTAGRPLALPPGVTVGTLDLVTDPDHLLKVARHVVAQVAQSYGMSYEQFTFAETADTASGKAYSVRRAKLTELRVEQRQRAVVHEREVSKLLGFADALSPDFAEQEMPADPLEELDVLDRRCNRGLDNPIAYLMRKDTDLTEDQATSRWLDNVSVTAWLFSLLRSLNLSFNGGSVANPGQTPQANGAAAHPSPGGPDRASGAATSADTGGDTSTATAA